LKQSEEEANIAKAKIEWEKHPKPLYFWPHIILDEWMTLQFLSKLFTSVQHFLARKVTLILEHFIVMNFIFINAWNAIALRSSQVETIVLKIIEIQA